MKKLPKRQFGSAGKGAMSYKYLANEKNHFLLFFDNPDNENNSLNEEAFTYKDNTEAIFNAYTISDETGDVTKVPILDTENFREMTMKQFNTNRIIILNKNEFALETYKKKKEDILIKVKMKD